jgi:purine-nucleoside phosphorylase
VSYFDQVQDAAAAVRAAVGDAPRIAIVLGSGLGDLAGTLRQSVVIRYEELPNWPAARAIGHEGRLVSGQLNARSVLVLSGRSHMYEGHHLRTVTFGVRVLGLLGVTTLILTNAAGGINTGMAQGALMVIDDHLNLMGANPLTGENDDRFGPRFPDMTEVYSRRLRRIADAAATATGGALAHGIYAAVAGPNYETPAEIRFLRAIGADAVGMSTVPEALVARHMGIEVLGLSCITNMAAGVLPQPIDHKEVVETAQRVRGQFTALLEHIVGML